MSLILDGTTGVPVTTVTGTLPVANGGTGGTTGATPSSALIGGHFTVAMAASACTIAIKTDAGNDPSAGEPVKMYVRSATATTGAMSLVSITAATSVVIPSTALMGTTSAVASRIYVGALNNAGTIELYAIMTLSGTSLYLPPEQALLTTTIMNTASDNAQIPYSTTARSAVAHRILGYFESTQATAGTWATAASVVQQMGDGVKRTGDMVQRLLTVTLSMATGSGTIPYDDTIPQITEGTEFLTQAITPSSALNVLAIVATLSISNAGANDLCCIAIFQDATANALVAEYRRSGQNTIQGETDTTVRYNMLAGTASSTTFRLRLGSENGSIMTLNGKQGARKFGGVLPSLIEIGEIVT